MVYAPTTDQLLNLDGVYQRSDSFRFVLLDRDEQTIGDLYPNLSRTPTVGFNSSGQNPRSLTNFDLTPDQQADINILSDRVQVFMDLENGDSYSLGIFLWGNGDRPYYSWGEALVSSLVDKSLILNQGIKKTIGFNRGADVGIAALGVALEVLALDEIILDAISADLGASRADAPGTSRTQILADFMELVGFLPPHFNRDGKLRLTDTPDLTMVTPTIPAYTVGADSRVIVNSVTRSDDGLQAPNTYIVYETSGQSTVRGEYNIDSSEPHSEDARGFPVPKVEGRTGLRTTAQANKAAKAMATTRSETFKWVNWSTPADPRHDAWDPVTVLGITYIETAWSLPCVPGGVMTHTARTVY